MGSHNLLSPFEMEELSGGALGIQASTCTAGRVKNVYTKHSNLLPSHLLCT